MRWCASSEDFDEWRSLNVENSMTKVIEKHRQIVLRCKFLRFTNLSKAEEQSLSDYINSGDYRWVMELIFCFERSFFKIFVIFEKIEVLISADIE